MKQKLFTLFTILILGIGSAWAEDYSQGYYTMSPGGGTSYRGFYSSGNSTSKYGGTGTQKSAVVFTFEKAGQDDVYYWYDCNNHKYIYADGDGYLQVADSKVTNYDNYKWFIKYDGNGADNPGAMTTDAFDYFAKSMKSKDNAFKRDGYRFTGFKVTIDGNTRIIRTPEEFVAELKKMGPYSSITLVAQWDEIPVRFTAPVTGIK